MIITLFKSFNFYKMIRLNLHSFFCNLLLSLWFLNAPRLCFSTWWQHIIKLFSLGFRVDIKGEFNNFRKFSCLNVLSKEGKYTVTVFLNTINHWNFNWPSFGWMVVSSSVKISLKDRGKLTFMQKLLFILSTFSEIPISG